MKKYKIDQTKFSVEQPLFEQIGALPEPEFVEQDVKPPLLKRRKVVIGLVIGITLLVLLILLLINTIINRSKLVAVPEASPTIEETRKVEVGPLLKRVEVVREELKEADPTKNELVFPTLDYSLRIDPKK